MSLHFIESVQYTLRQIIPLLDNISEEDFTNTSYPPYFSSIGKHTRHIIDFYQCIFNGLNNYLIDLTDRKREEALENYPLIAKERVLAVIEELNDYKNYDLSEKYELIDDFGLGKQSIPTNLYSVFSQANSHSIHHYAIIAQLLDLMNISIELEYFGYNPSTPNKVEIKTSR